MTKSILLFSFLLISLNVFSFNNEDSTRHEGNVKLHIGRGFVKFQKDSIDNKKNHLAFDFGVDATIKKTRNFSMGLFYSLLVVARFINDSVYDYSSGGQGCTTCQHFYIVNHYNSYVGHQLGLVLDFNLFDNKNNNLSVQLNEGYYLLYQKYSDSQSPANDQSTYCEGIISRLKLPFELKTSKEIKIGLAPVISVQKVRGEFYNNSYYYSTSYRNTYLMSYFLEFSFSFRII